MFGFVGAVEEVTLKDKKKKKHSFQFVGVLFMLVLPFLLSTPVSGDS